MPEATYIDIHTDYLPESNTLMKLAQMAILKDNWNGYEVDLYLSSTS